MLHCVQNRPHRGALGFVAFVAVFKRRLDLQQLIIVFILHLSTRQKKGQSDVVEISIGRPTGHSVDKEHKGIDGLDGRGSSNKERH